LKKLHDFRLNGKLPKKISFNENPPVGYGNRLYSMLSSTLIGIITNSAVLIKWDRIDEFIQEPFHESFVKTYSFKKTLYKPKTLYEWSKYKDMKRLIKTQVPQYSNGYYYDTFSPFFFELSCNPDYFEALFQFGLVSRSTIDQANKAIDNIFQTNNELSQSLITKVGFEVGGNLLNKIWIPKSNILSRINHYLTNVFDKYFMIGLQLRYDYIIDDEDTSKFIHCARMIESKWSNLIKEKYNGAKWFVTSDRQDILDRLVKLYPDKIITSDGKAGHILFNNDSYPKTIMDVELLSKCNELIITGISTYGFVSAMKMLKLPYYITAGGMKECVKFDLGSPPTTNTGLALF
jgi:hypothetical protein